MNTNFSLVDLEEAQHFLQIIDPTTDRFTFQTFPDPEDKKGDHSLKRVLHGTLAEHAQTLLNLSGNGAGIFVTINKTNLQGRKAEDIVGVRAVYVDLDGAPLEPVLDYELKPHAVVSTSEGKWHAYWLVDDFDLEWFEDTQLWLINRFDSDQQVTQVNRVMRLPGFPHRKGTPTPVRIIETNEGPAYAGRLFWRAPREKKEPLSAQATASDPSVEKADALTFLESETRKVAESSSGKRNNDLNKAAYTLGGLVGSGLLDEETVRERLLDAALEADLRRSEALATIKSGLNKGKLAPWSPRNLLDPADPMRTAAKLLDTKYTDPQGRRTLLRHRESFWDWNGACYVERDREDMDAVVWAYTERAFAITRNGPEPFKPNPDKVSGIIAALRSRTLIDTSIDFPVWLNGADDAPPPSEFMAVGNGLLHLPSGEMWPPTPHYFNTSASKVTYSLDAPWPTAWLRFLDEVYGDDKEALASTQEFFGYCLLPDTSQQKILLVVGPPRSGKGTMGRVLRELVGPNSVAGPTMHSLGGDFGLEPLIPRPVAIISDARIGAKTDKAAVTERLLSISGEDTLSVNRKNRSFWHGKLLTRFIILTNELPALSDGSGALANRFIIIVLKRSFLGTEDPGLFDKLKGELPGILNWAVEGYERLRQRGHFVQPTSGREAMEDIQKLSAPVRAFLAEECEVGPGMQQDSEMLWDRWKEWTLRNGNHPGSKNWFGRNLKTVLPGLAVSDTTVNGVRTSIYKGIQLRDRTETTQNASMKASDPNLPF